MQYGVIDSITEAAFRDLSTVVVAFDELVTPCRAFDIT